MNTSLISTSQRIQFGGTPLNSIKPKIRTYLRKVASFIEQLKMICLYGDTVGKSLVDDLVDFECGG